MTKLRSVIYRSKALIEPLSNEEQTLMDFVLLENRKLGITGFLVRNGDEYFQYIEGKERVIHDVVERIRRNPLHSGFTMIAEDSPEERNFPRWYMEYCFLDEEEAKQHFKTGGSDEDLAASVLQLMKKKAAKRGEVGFRCLK